MHSLEINTNDSERYFHEWNEYSGNINLALTLVTVGNAPKVKRLPVTMFKSNYNRNISNLFSGATDKPSISNQITTNDATYDNQNEEKREYYSFAGDSKGSETAISINDLYDYVDKGRGTKGPIEKEFEVYIRIHYNFYIQMLFRFCSIMNKSEQCILTWLTMQINWKQI